MRKIVVLIIMAFCALNLNAQIELGECEQPYDDKVDRQVQKAVTSMNKKDYKMARIYINNALEVDPQNAHSLYLMGELAIKEKNILKTEAYWTQLMDVCPDYLAEVQFYLSVIYLENGKESKAEEMLERFLKNPERDRGYDKEAKQILKEIRLQENLFANPVPFDPKPVKSICTKEDEYLAIISPDQELCFFTRRSKKEDKYSGPAKRTRIVEEFSLANRLENGNYEQGVPMEFPFNENYNEGGPSITADNNLLFFTVCQMGKDGYENCDIYYSKKDEYGYWGSINSVGDHINTPNAWESQPSVSADGKFLYFVSNREGGVGGLDLYVCKRKLNGEWEAPVNLGKEINTYKNEKSPFIHSDSETLYFASDGHPTLGGYDIYYSKADIDNMEFGIPENIGYPINTKADEIALFVSLNGKKAYFSSNKLNGPGGWDFYSFDLYEEARPEKVALVKGTLLDENQEVVRDAELQIKNLKTKEIQRVDVDVNTGKYTAVVKLKDKENMILKVKKEGSAFTSKMIDIEDDESTGVVEAEFEVAPITVGKEYRLNDINFATDSYELTEKAKYVIEEFMLFLEENPSVKADIQGHTDNAGDPNDNLVLSRNRAKVVYDYLVNGGISPNRLTSHGFGETRPIASNSSEKGMAKNRRTVFVITSR